MQTIQVYQVTPDQLKDLILNGVKEQLAELKKDFQPKTPTELLTRNEVAELLKIDLSTLWAWTNKRKVKAYGIGNRVYYKRNEIEEMLKPLNS